MLATARLFLLVTLAVPLVGMPVIAAQPRAAEANASPPPAEVLDGLLGQLHQAADEASAKVVEQAIWQAWMRSGSPTVDLLVQQAEKAMGDKQHRIAISILSTAIELEPEFPEVWNRRATAYYLDRQFELSLADAEKVLELEPRHFAALAGLGILHQEMGDERAALEAFRRALAIHPFLPLARRAVKELELELEQDI
ncbi:MAG TPA: tetratricopeptide repeat protein [Aestuariivirgaceae bacterium]|nr:tetratricopeptide repeat protein [Aestuariivirgaceae bacterium]